MKIRKVALILTADIMKIMIDFYQKTGIIYEITIKENRIYLRFSIGKMFEPKIFGNCIDKEKLYTYYYTFKFITEVTEKINKIASEIDV